MPIEYTRTLRVIGYMVAISLVVFVLIEVIHIIYFHGSRCRAELQREMLTEIRHVSALVCSGYSLGDLITKFQATDLFEMSKAEVEALPTVSEGAGVYMTEHKIGRWTGRSMRLMVLWGCTTVALRSAWTRGGFRR